MAGGRPSDYTVELTDRICAEIYGLYCPLTGALRYIGKARDSMARLNSHMRDSRRRGTPLYAWIRGLGRPPIMRVLLVTWCWEADERELIAQHRADGADLLNVAAGGNAPCCPRVVRKANGRKVAASVHGNPLRRRIWEINRQLGSLLGDGRVSEAAKAKLRGAAAKRPDLFGRWGVI